MRLFLFSAVASFLFALPSVAQVLPPACSSGSPVVCQFEGIDASQVQGVGPNVDPNGAVGTKQYLEWTNPVYQGYSKIFPYAPVWPSGPVDGSTPWRFHISNCVGAAGNVVVNFDKLASRWVIGRRQGNGNSSPFYYCIAVSSTDDLNNLTWYPFGFDLTSILGTNAEGHTYYPDYPKLSTWPDAYYVTIDVEDPDNGFPEVGVISCAFDRTNMLKNLTPRPPQCFRYPSSFGSGSEPFPAHSILPADFDGTILPAKGMPNVMVSLENPAAGQTTSNTFNLWEFHVDWTTPSKSTFTGPTPLTVPTYTQGCYFPDLPTNTVCVPEPSTPQTNNHIDAVGDRLMQRLTYRGFGGAHPYFSFVFSHTVQVGSGVQSQTGIAWYEFRAKGLVHHGVINPGDSDYRFMPSAAQDKVGNMAAGYSISGLDTHPGIRASYLNLNRNLPPTELDLFDGTADEENTFHWGVYSSMTVDPSDDCTFWYVNEYFDVAQLTNPTWQTRISNFKLSNCK